MRRARDTTDGQASWNSPSKLVLPRRSRPQGAQRDSTGQAMVEFATSLTIFLMVLLGIFWFGLQFFRLYALYSAAEAGVREGAIVGGNPGGVPAAQTCGAGVQGETTTFVCGHLREWLGDTADGVEVTVADAYDVPVVTVPYNALIKVRATLPASFNILGREFAFDLSATRVKRVERESTFFGGGPGPR